MIKNDEDIFKIKINKYAIEKSKHCIIELMVGTIEALHEKIPSVDNNLFWN